MKKLCVVIFMLLTCLFMTLEPLSVFAVNDIDNNKEKNLTVYFFVQKLGINKPIEGAEVGITKIADIEVKNGNIVYKVVDKYAVLKDIKFDGMTVDESRNAAKEFNAIVEVEKTGITNMSGKCMFNNLESGVYLVKQLAAEGKAEGYAKFEPYIILVPYADNYLPEWNYDILSEPKTVNIIEPSEPSLESSEPSDISEPSLEFSEPSDISKYSEISHSDISVDQPSDSVTTGDTSGIFVVMLCVICLSAFVVVIAEGADRNVQ